jgi:hypothetical protein
MPTQTELSTRWLLTVGAIMSLCDDHRKGRCIQDVSRVCTNLQKECHEECQRQSRQSENLSLETLGRDTGRHRESLVLSHDRRVRDRVLAGKKRRGGRKRAQEGARGRKREHTTDVLVRFCETQLGLVWLVQGDLKTSLGLDVGDTSVELGGKATGRLWDRQRTTAHHAVGRDADSLGRF